MYRVEIIEEQEKWNQVVSGSCNPNVFGLFEWGKFKESSWIVNRVAVYKNDSLQGATQILLKKAPGVIFGWAASGVFVTNYKHLEIVIEKIREHYAAKALFHYLRFNFCENSTGDSSFRIRCLDLLKASSNPVNSGFTVRFKLEKAQEIEKEMSSNNRYYLKKALKENLVFKKENEVNAEAFTSLHNLMTSSKDLQQIEINLETISSLKNSLAENLNMFSVYKDEECLSSCLVIRSKKQAFYYLAATSNKGREVYASFFMIANLLKELANEGITDFDFSGITPYDKNAAGVNRFKMGFGGEVINYLGEWEISNNWFVSKLFNWLVAKKL